MKKGEINVLVSPQEKYSSNIAELAESFSSNFGITCYVSVNKLHGALMRDFNEAGIDTNKFLFVDAVTKSINPQAQAQNNCIFVDSPSDLTKLSITISEILSSEKIDGLIFDSISTLLVYNQDITVYKFIHSLVNNIKQHSKTAVLIISEGENTDKMLDELSMYVDNITHSKENSEIVLNENAKQDERGLIYLTSHEMRTPLTSIVSLIPLIADEKLGKLNAKQKETLDLVYYDARRMALLVDNMIDIFEVDKGLTISKTQKFDFGELAKEILSSLKFMLEKKKINLKTDIQQTLIVKADRSRIKRAVFNVLMNAVKYCKEGGNIQISAKRENYNILISVRDDGMGIKKEQLLVLFSKPIISVQKYDLNESEKKPLSGVGYGLYIAKKVIEAHKGKIWAESEEGKGAVFYMLFPMEQNA